MPSRLCLEPTCPNVAVYRGRCAEHARVNERSIQRAGRKIYRTKRWKITRDRQLAQHPLCQCENHDCHGIATDVDHRIPLHQGGDPWHPSNLQSLTHTCHSRKTRSEQWPQPASSSPRASI